MKLRVALLQHHATGPSSGEAQQVHELAQGLREQGHTATVTSASPQRIARLSEDVLRRRGFTGSLTQVPLALRALRRSDADVAHAFSVADAAAALRWKHATGRPVVFTCLEPIARAGLADRRLRLRLFGAAIEQSDAVVVPDEPAREQLLKWMAAEAIVIDDVSHHQHLYERLMT